MRNQIFQKKLTVVDARFGGGDSNSLDDFLSWQERFPGLTLLEQVTVDGVFQIAFFLCFLVIWFMGFVEFGQILTEPGLSDHERRARRWAFTFKMVKRLLGVFFVFIAVAMVWSWLM